MELLKVPYISQINPAACGAAVLEMVYRYYGISRFSQAELMDEYQELEPHNSGNLRLTTDALVADARKRGFNASWIRVNYEDTKESIFLLKVLITAGLPVIVCQKASDQDPLLGHFRIIVGINDHDIYLHDPDYKFGGEKLQWSIKKFMEFWQPTGQNVTGGVLCLVNK